MVKGLGSGVRDFGLMVWGQGLRVKGGSRIRVRDL
jgi:hypothetical protein